MAAQKVLAQIASFRKHFYLVGLFFRERVNYP